jgi:16S rRNA (guanine527-N7)-methyltransferase
MNFKPDIDNLRNLLNKYQIPFREESIPPLMDYFDSLIKKKDDFNLTGFKTGEEIIHNLFINSLAILKFVEFPPESTVLDIGAGAGFPGIPLKILNPSIHMSLLDSSGKKIDFIRQNTTKLDKINLINQRAEKAAHLPEFREKYDFVLAKALAPIPEALELCIPFVQQGGKFIVWKGPKARDEMKETEAIFNLLGIGSCRNFTVYQEEIDRTTIFLIFDKKRKTPANFPRSFQVIKRKSIIDLVV